MEADLKCFHGESNREKVRQYIGDEGEEESFGLSRRSPSNIKGFFKILGYSPRGEVIWAFDIKNINKRFYAPIPGQGNTKMVRVIGEFELDTYNLKIPFINFNLYRNIDVKTCLRNYIPWLEIHPICHDIINKKLINDTNMHMFIISKSKMVIDYSWIIDEKITTFAGRITDYPIYEDHTGKLEEATRFINRGYSLHDLISNYIPNYENIYQAYDSILALSYKIPKNLKYPPAVIHPYNEEIFPCRNIECEDLNVMNYKNMRIDIL